MAVIKCKICGGDITLSEDRTFGVCEFCGSQVTLPKIDDDQRAAAFNRGNQFRLNGDFDRAIGVYEHILEEDDTDAEAHWCAALCRFGIEYVQDPASHEWLPTCHRLSFDSFLEDVDYLAALENSDGETRLQYEKDGAKIAEVQRGVLATSQNEDPYDVFICYKETDEHGQRTRDSLLAQDIYYQLTEKGWRVFFARITLEEHAGTEYEPYIFAALNSAKVMIVVGTRPEYLNAVWVKNEWSRFRAMMKKDRKKLLLPCYRDMDPYELPEQLSMLQSYDMSKIGFIQDLIRGVGKVLDAEKKPEPAVVVQQRGVGNSGALLKRGNLALEDGEWEKADEFFEEVLNQDAENADAYLGKALVESRCRSLDELVEMRTGDLSDIAPEQLYAGPDEAYIDQAAERYAIPGYVETREVRELYSGRVPYLSVADGVRQRRDSEEAYWRQSKNLGRAMRFASGGQKKDIEGALARVLALMDQRIAQVEHEDDEAQTQAQEQYAELLREADARAQRLNELGEERRESDYQTARSVYNANSDPAALTEAAKIFQALGSYKDCASLAVDCPRRAEAITKAALRKKRKRISIGVLAGAAVLGVFLLVTQVIMPGIREHKMNQTLEQGRELLAAEDYDGAIEIFQSLNGYGESRALLEQAQTEKTEAENAAAYAEAEQLLAEEDYDGAIAAFEALGDYSDSEDRAEQAREDRTQAELAASYARAEQLMAEERYEEAGSIYTALGDYMDSAERSAEAMDLELLKNNRETYAQAEQLMADGQYDEALWTFFSIGDFEDSYDRVLECAALEGDQMIASGDYDSAVILCGEFGLTDKVDEAQYAKAGALQKAGDYDGAIDIYQSLGDYSDSAAQIQAATYAKADSQAAAGDHAAAASIFQSLGDYSDSVERAQAASYAAADEMQAEGDFDGAIAAFEALGDYSDSADRALAAAYAAADEMQAKGDFDGAIAAFQALGDYSDSEDRAEGANIAKLDAAYADAEAKLADGLYSDAEAAFTALNGYRDSAARAADVSYVAASDTALKDPARGALAFAALGDLADARLRSLALWDQVAVRDTITVGSYFSAAVRTDGTVMTVGTNEYGQRNVEGWTDIVAIAAGRRHIVGLRSDGTVVAAGSNEFGQCNVAGWTDIVAVTAGGDYTLGLKMNGTVVAVGDNADGQLNVAGWTDIVALATKKVAAQNFVLGLRSDGTVLAAGDNYYRQTEVSEWTGMVAIAAGDEQSVGLAEDGSVTVQSRLWHPSATEDWNDVVAIAAGPSRAVGIRPDGSVWVAYPIGDTVAEIIKGWTNVAAVAMGPVHTLALHSDGTAIAAGDNEYGQCDVTGWTDIRQPGPGSAAPITARDPAPANYAAADVLLAGGDYDGAIRTFQALGDYSDSAERAEEADAARQAAEQLPEQPAEQPAA